MAKLKYEEMLTEEIVAAREKLPLVYVPIGSIEYHGLHLPAGFDSISAYELCLRAAAQTGGVVLPPTYWGTRGHEGFEGSLLLREETIAALVRNILEEIARLGYKLVVLFTGHHPDVQGVLLQKVADEFMAADSRMQVVVLDPFYIYPNELGIEHAGKQETSMMLYLRPDLVKMENTQLSGALYRISEDCLDASAEFGRQLVETVVAALAQRVKDALAALPPAT